MRFNKGSTEGDKLLSGIRGYLERRGVDFMRLNKMITGPRLPLIERKVRLKGGRNMSFILTMNKNSILSSSGTVTGKLTGPRMSI